MDGSTWVESDIVEIEPGKKVVVEDTFVQNLPGEGSVAEKLTAKPEGGVFSYLEGYILGLTAEETASAPKPFLKVVTEGEAAAETDRGQGHDR